MKMVLQLQSTKKYKNTDLYCGEATYLTYMLFDQTEFSTAEKEVRNVLENIAKIKMLTMTIDGNSGHWGCTTHYTDALQPLPLAFGINDSPEAVYDYYIDYAERYCEKLNMAKNENGEYLYNEITKICQVIESNNGLVLSVVYDQTDMGELTIPYPT